VCTASVEEYISNDTFITSDGKEIITFAGEDDK
jgi:hypothetical protein